MKSIKICLAICLISLLFSSQVFAVSNVKQENDSWCWSASAVSVIKEFGTAPTQCNFVKNTKGTTTCSATGETLYNTQVGIAKYGITSTYTAATLSFSSLQTQISNGKAVLVSWLWTDGGGHMVVADGTDVSYWSGTSYVNYMDPWYGSHYSKTYSSFTKSSQHEWKESGYGFAKN